MGRLDGKVAVVTGGANGIGRACCERFAEEGADVVVADILDGPAADTVAAVEALSRKALFIKADAASADDNEAIMQRATEAFGGIDIVVTAAGISHARYRSGDSEPDRQLIAEAMSQADDPARLWATTPFEQWQRVLDVNLTGTFLAVQSAVRHMLEQGRTGSIITIASVAAKQPKAGPLPYAVSKAGVWMLTKHAARNLAAAGIRVNAIGPGYIATHMTSIVSQVPGARDDVVAEIPMGRMGTPREVANLALFLASDESSYLTGELLHPDGGYYTD